MIVDGGSLYEDLDVFFFFSFNLRGFFTIGCNLQILLLINTVTAMSVSKKKNL